MADMESLFAAASPEFPLVTACCRWPIDTAAIRRAFGSPIQWHTVLSLANRHGVSGFVAHALAGIAEVPQETQRALAETKRKLLLKNLAMLRDQIQLRDLLQEHSVPFAFLKGTPLAMQAYGTIALRQSKDIDLLVREGDVDRVDNLLRSLNYQRTGLSLNLNAAQRKLWTESVKHHTYTALETGVPLELHWRTRDNRLMESKFDPLNNVEQIRVAPGETLPALSHEELLLDLCVHGAGHAWFRLKWLADVAALLQRSTATERSALLEHSIRAGLERPVLQAMHLCHLVFERPLLVTGVPPTLPLQLLVRIAANALLQEDVRPPSAVANFVPRGQALARMLLHTGWRYRAEELRLLMTSPADWQQVSLPVALQFLYPALRAPLWVKRRLQRPVLGRIDSE